MKEKNSGSNITSGKPQAGTKSDGGKLDYSLIPPETTRALVEVLMAGNRKYQRDNWKLVDNFDNRYYSAMMRHMEAWRSGEKADQEDGLSHLAHAMACVMFLLWRHLQFPKFDKVERRFPLPSKEEIERGVRVTVPVSPIPRVFLCYDTPDYEGDERCKKILGMLTSHILSHWPMEGWPLQGATPNIDHQFTAVGDPLGLYHAVVTCDLFVLVGNHVTDRMAKWIDWAEETGRRIVEMDGREVMGKVEEEDHKGAARGPEVPR